MAEETFDFLVAGAGIVGLATALELNKRRPSARIAVLEKEPRPGLHASGRNSGVLHSGIYYSHDTLKAKFCAVGAARMREFAAAHGIPCQRWGKVIIATREADLPVLDRLLINARLNGIRAESLDEKGVRAIEPRATPYRRGIYSPDTAVIDSKAVLHKLAEILVSRGVRIFFDRKVRGADPVKNRVFTDAGPIGFGFLYNCAGAHADRLARHFGLSENHVLVPFKGLYYKLRPERNDLVKSSIYPVPDPLLPFLGVHLTRVVSGDVYVGPTAIPALGRENYGILQGAHLGESLEIAWQITRLYMSNLQNFRVLVHGEMKKYIKRYFLESAGRLVEGLVSEDLVPTEKVGIRPQLINLRERKLEMDFIVERTPRSAHVLNAISPAFTSAFAFAEWLVAENLKTGTQ